MSCRDERVGDDPAAVRCPMEGEDDSDEEEPFAGAKGGGNEYWREIRSDLRSIYVHSAVASCRDVGF